MEVVTKEISNPDVNPLYDKEMSTPFMEALEEGLAPKQSKRMYHIYHAVNKMFIGTEKEKMPREYVGFVMADSLEEAYKMAQNDFNPAYEMYNVRSTCVGDLIQDNYGFYMVCNVGFRLLCKLDEDGQE